MKKELMQRVEIISPDRARQLLLLNENNRPIIKANLKKLCRELINGQWKMNGETIKISSDGAVLDGQHRLHAVVQTGISIETMIVYGLNDDVFATIDQGAQRSLSAILSIEKNANAKVCASIVPLLRKYKNNKIPNQFDYGEISKIESLAFFNENKAVIVRAATFVASNKNLKKIISPGYLGFLYVVFYEIDSSACSDFFNKLSVGMFYNEKDPIRVLRERLIDIATSKNKEDQVYRSAYTIFAWNAYRKNKEITFLRWTTMGNTTQDYPRAI